MQSFSSTSEVQRGHLASFAIWVWSTKAASKGVTVRTHIGFAAFVASPRFTVCPVAHGAECSIGNLPTGLADELQVTVRVGAKAAAGEQVELFAKASAKGSLSFQSSATDIVVVPPVPNPTPPLLALPPTSLPTILGSGVSPSNPSQLFPTVPGPSNSAPGSLGLPRVKPRRVAHGAAVAATVPMDARLIGGQLAGLAVLAGAVAIAIARLSLRKSQPQNDGGNRATGQD